MTTTRTVYRHGNKAGNRSETVQREAVRMRPCSCCKDREQIAAVRRVITRVAGATADVRLFGSSVSDGAQGLRPARIGNCLESRFRFDPSPTVLTYSSQSEQAAQRAPPGDTVVAVACPKPANGPTRSPPPASSRMPVRFLPTGVALSKAQTTRHKRQGNICPLLLCYTC